MDGGGGRPSNVKVSVSLNGGTPLSVTFTVTWLVVGTIVNGGLQLKSPLPALSVAPAGAPLRIDQVNVWLAWASVAVMVKLRGWPKVAILVPTVAIVGGVLPAVR